MTGVETYEDGVYAVTRNDLIAALSTAALAPLTAEEVTKPGDEALVELMAPPATVR